MLSYYGTSNDGFKTVCTFFVTPPKKKCASSKVCIPIWLYEAYEVNYLTVEASSEPVKQFLRNKRKILYFWN